MSDMVDRVEMPGDGSVDNKEKGENKLAADIADTLDNNSIKEKLFKEFLKIIKNEAVMFFMILENYLIKIWSIKIL